MAEKFYLVWGEIPGEVWFICTMYTKFNYVDNFIEITKEEYDILKEIL